MVNNADNAGKNWRFLALAALGVVYGDIGTSPLYALRECFHGANALELTRGNILGVLSLVFWALTLVVTVKYLVFILRADNYGEGGILALTALLISDDKPAKIRNLIIALGLLGAALLYADGMITPAISVLSAVEGIELVAPISKSVLEVLAVAILIGLFWVQSGGTGRIGAVFGPLMAIWFCLLAIAGLVHIAMRPEVLMAINPFYGFEFLYKSGSTGYLILGTIFLVVTGGEALYADIGHFGVFPIRLTWFALVFPSLLLNYFGQGALLLRDPSAVVNPLYHMFPAWALYPMIVIATSAAIIASQAVITGAFSLTLQAIQLGFCPRLRVEHTSRDQKGQIYIPAVNLVLMLATIALVLGFRSSSNLAAAYGIAITFTMTVTTLLFFILIRDRWKWHPAFAVLFVVLFLAIDLAFTGANLLKFVHGGWFPLLVAGVIYLLLNTWSDGKRLLSVRRTTCVPINQFASDLKSDALHRVPGTAVFLTSDSARVPLALVQNVTHNHVLHEHNIILEVRTVEVPRVSSAKRQEAVEEIKDGLLRVNLIYGFMQRPDVPRDLAEVKHRGHTIDAQTATYFLSRQTLLATESPGMYVWRERLFAFMARNAQPATIFFRLPPERIMEIGAQIEL